MSALLYTVDNICSRYYKDVVTTFDITCALVNSIYICIFYEAIVCIRKQFTFFLNRKYYRYTTIIVLFKYYLYFPLYTPVTAVSKILNIICIGHIKKNDEFSKWENVSPSA